MSMTAFQRIFGHSFRMKLSLALTFGVLLTIAVSPSALAKSSARSQSDFKGNINAGDFLVSGSSGVDFLHVGLKGGGSQTLFDLATTTAYMVDFGLGVGATVGVRSTQVTDFIYGGPTGIYYLVTDQKIGIPVTASLLFQHYSVLDDSRFNVALQAGIGFEYFLSPSVSVGPNLRLRQIVGDIQRGDELRSVAVIGTFNLFL